MRTAIISDVHANFFALQSVFADIDAQKPDRIICLGDTIGYGPHPSFCLDLVRERCSVVLAGSDEFALFAESESKAFFSENIRKVLDWTRSELKSQTYDEVDVCDARWKWLKKMSNRYESGSVIYTFGSPVDGFRMPGNGLLDAEHILAEDFSIEKTMGCTHKVLGAFAAMQSLCFIGNTHRAGFGTSERWTRPSECSKITLDRNQKTIVNAGSVGQPRDGDPRACWVLFNESEYSIEFRKVEYDIARAQAEFSKVPIIPANFSERLAKGV